MPLHDSPPTAHPPKPTASASQQLRNGAAKGPRRQQSFSSTVKRQAAQTKPKNAQALTAEQAAQHQKAQIVQRFTQQHFAESAALANSPSLAHSASLAHSGALPQHFLHQQQLQHAATQRLHASQALRQQSHQLVTQKRQHESSSQPGHQVQHANTHPALQQGNPISRPRSSQPGSAAVTQQQQHQNALAHQHLQFQFQQQQQQNAQRMQPRQQRQQSAHPLSQPEQQRQAFMQSSHFAMQSSNPSPVFPGMPHFPQASNGASHAFDGMTTSFDHQSSQPAQEPHSVRQPSSQKYRQLIGMGLSGSDSPLPDQAFMAADGRAPGCTLRKVTSSEEFVANSPIIRMVGLGPCVQQLMKFSEEQKQGQLKNSVEDFWKPFVKSFFTPNATILMDVTFLQNGNPRSIELPVEAMPRIFKSKYDAGVTEDRLLLENPCEFVLENGIVVVDCPQAIVLTTYKESKVCTMGHLRVSFTDEKKIICWEFSTKRHEELFNREAIGKGPLPSPVCTPYGIPSSSVLLFAIAESISEMKPSLDSNIKILAANGVEFPIGGSPEKIKPEKEAQNGGDQGNIISQLKETASLFPSDSKEKIAVPLLQVPTLNTDFGIGVSGAASLSPFTMDQQVQTSLQSPTPVQLQVARLQAQAQQRTRANQLSIEARHSRIPIEAIQPNQVASDIIPGLLENPGFQNQSSPAQGNQAGSALRTNVPTSQSTLAHSAAWQASLSGGLTGIQDPSTALRESMRGINVSTSLFPDGNPTLETGNDPNIGALNEVKGPASAPPGLSMFTPNSSTLFDTAAKVSADGFSMPTDFAQSMRGMSAGIGAGLVGGIGIPGTGQNGLKAELVGDALNGGMLSDHVGPYAFDPFKVSAAQHARMAPMSAGGGNPSALQVAANEIGEVGMSSSAGGKRSSMNAGQTNSMGKASKRRRSGSNSNSVL